MPIRDDTAGPPEDDQDDSYEDDDLRAVATLADTCTALSAAAPARALAAAWTTAWKNCGLTPLSTTVAVVSELLAACFWAGSVVVAADADSATGATNSVVAAATAATPV